jgi:hypothetical protein
MKRREEINKYTSCQSENAFDDISTSSTYEHDVSTACGSPTCEIRSSVKTTVDELRTRPDSTREKKKGIIE